jgi:hypothetical protein
VRSAIALDVQYVISVSMSQQYIIGLQIIDINNDLVPEINLLKCVFHLLQSLVMRVRKKVIFIFIVLCLLLYYLFSYHYLPPKTRLQISLLLMIPYKLKAEYIEKKCLPVF